MDEIKVINYDEFPDGSACVTLELPREAVETLIGAGVIKLIEDRIARETNKTEG